MKPPATSPLKVPSRATWSLRPFWLPMFQKSGLRPSYSVEVQAFQMPWWCLWSTG